MVGATAARAIEIDLGTSSSSRVTAAAAPTTAISIARRYSNRTYALPERSGRQGNVIAVQSSVEAAVVRPGACQSPAIGTLRSPSTEASFTEAPSTTSGAPVSMAGEAFITLPPMVPVPRVAGDPIRAAASASAV